jgi:hypothetical protein
MNKIVLTFVSSVAALGAAIDPAFAEWGGVFHTAKKAGLLAAAKKGWGLA